MISVDRVRRTVARRQVWQAFLGWFKSGDREGSVPSRGMAFAMSSPATVPNEQIDPRMLFDEEAQVDFDDDELLEFLEADADPVPADPEFREQLRERLWGMVQQGMTALPKDH